MQGGIGNPVSRIGKLLHPDFGLDPDTELAGRVRAKQIASLAKLTPFMMLTNLSCGIITVILLNGVFSAFWTGVWFLGLCALVVTGLLSYRHHQNSVLRDTVSMRALNKAAYWSAVLASLWAAIGIAVYPVVPVETQLVIIALLSGMMGGGTMSFYVIPKALGIWLLVLAGGSTIGLTLSGSSESLTVLGLLIVFTAALYKSGLSMAATYIFREVSAQENQDQADTIKLLLKDFSENASDWLWEMDAHGNIVRGKQEFSCALKSQIGLTDDTSCNNDEEEQGDYTLAKRGVRAFWKKFKQRESFKDLQVSSEADGESRWVQISGKPVFDQNNEFTGFRGVGSDITESKLAEERIAFLAHNDALTGLVNRSEFSSRLGQKMRVSNEDDIWFVFYLDLDGFKNVNDQYGHAAGDGLLSEVARRMKLCVGEKDVVARLGGDEFAILVSSVHSLEAAAGLAEMLIARVSQSYEWEGTQTEVSVSIGIANGARDGNSTYKLLNNADLALYRAKAEGKHTYRFYEHEMDEIVKERRALENQLRLALRNEQLSLSFQPLVSVDDQKTTGFEALVRWNHPTKGVIAPSDFIPLAERLGIITELGTWILLEACRNAVQWPSQLSVSVNLSPQQFLGNDIVAQVRHALEETGLEPKRLELEITEGLFMENTDEVIEALTMLKEMGISIAMDDFGTGYSSLSYIMKFPFDKLKIDRSFISSIDSDEVAKNVMETIMKLGNVLELKVTAEGVETRKQAEMLTGMSCNFLQGYLFGKPIPATELAGFILSEFNRENKDQTKAPVAAKAVNE